jgi:hypothetical protein
MFAAKNDCSIRSSGTTTATTRKIGHCQHFQMTKKAIIVSITIAAVTDTP